MPLRPPAGFISAFYNPLQVPNAPTGVSASAGNAQATVSFTAPTNVGGGAITGYGAAAVKTSDGTTLTNTGASSPITVTGLTNGSAYTMNVWAINSFGPSPFGTSGSVTPVAPTGFFAGGGSYTNVIDSIVIATTGNATSFGDLIQVKDKLGALGSSTRGVFGGGQIDGSTYTNVIEYITFSTSSNTTDFGDLLAATTALAAASNSTRGIFSGGYTTDRTNVIAYITIASVGNATDFGDLTVTRDNLNTSGLASTTRALFAGGNNTSAQYVNVIDYVTIATTGNATDFGDSAYVFVWGGACASSTRGLLAGGYDGTSFYNNISYVTIASTGNAVDFGDLSSTAYGNAGCSSETRGVFSLGNASLVYVTIASTGNSTTFGNLTSSRRYLAACSSVHGGL